MKARIRGSQEIVEVFSTGIKGKNVYTGVNTNTEYQEVRCVSAQRYRGLRVNTNTEYQEGALELLDDKVNHPKHYTSHPSGVECITITQHHNFCIGNVIKYVWRAGLKGEDTTIEDLEKAKWYLEKEIERLSNA